MSQAEFPRIETNRLILRAFTLSDAPGVQRMAGDEDVARNTLAMPFPYLEGMADTWIATHRQEFDERKSVILAITLRENNILAGAVGLGLQLPYSYAELGYWIGREFWGKGYCTEAVRAVIDFGFYQLKLHKIFASHFSNNPASGKVMMKAGMKYEATLKSHMLHWGEHKDLVYYGIWRKEDGIVTQA